MQKKLKLFVMALCIAPTLHAQEADSLSVEMQEEQAFTFTEAQLGTDDDMSQNVIIVSSNQNIYASQAGYLFSPGRFRYRAFNHLHQWFADERYGVGTVPLFNGRWLESTDAYGRECIAV